MFASPAATVGSSWQKAMRAMQGTGGHHHHALNRLFLFTISLGVFVLKTIGLV